MAYVVGQLSTWAARQHFMQLPLLWHAGPSCCCSVIEYTFLCTMHMTMVMQLPSQLSAHGFQVYLPHKQVSLLLLLQLPWFAAITVIRVCSITTPPRVPALDYQPAFFSSATSCSLNLSPKPEHIIRESARCQCCEGGTMPAMQLRRSAASAARTLQRSAEQ